jgi:hypothetical protein
MLFDGQRRFRDLDLLHDPGQMPIPAQAPAATRAGLEPVFLEVGDLLGGKRRAFILGMTGLAPRPAGAGGLVRRRRLDDVGGRGLGRGRGVFLGSGQLLPELGDLGMQRIDARLQSVHSRLQLLALPTRCPCWSGHDPSR